jgi:hypothetical protein
VAPARAGETPRVQPSSASAYGWPPPPQVDAAQPERPKSEWYGGYLLVAYALPPLGFVLSRDANGNALPVVLSLFAAPIVHWVHHKSGNGWLALFMQPVFGGLGALAGGTGCRMGCDTQEVVGAALGYSLWVAIDVAALAHAPAERKRSAFVVEPLKTSTATGLEVSGVF